MSKNYQRRENYNPETDLQTADSEVLASEDVVVSSTPEVVVKAAVSAAPQPTPTVTPTPVQPQKAISMLPVQTELSALAQALNPKQPVLPRWQYSVFQLLKKTIENDDGAVFYQNWSAILKFYHSAKGTAFSDIYMLRFSDEWPGSDAEFSLFRRLVHIVSETSDPQTRRKAATMINFSRATEGLKEDARNRLIGFYS